MLSLSLQSSKQRHGARYDTYVDRNGDEWFTFKYPPEIKGTLVCAVGKEHIREGVLHYLERRAVCQKHLQEVVVGEQVVS